jgi:hypothetical protein
MEDRIGGQQTMMEDRVAENGEDEFAELGADQKVALGKWFLLNSPPGQVQQVAKGKSLLFFGGPTGNCLRIICLCVVTFAFPIVRALVTTILQ